MKKLVLAICLGFLGSGSLGAIFSALVLVQDPQKNPLPAGAWNFQVQVRDLGSDWEISLQIPPGDKKPFLLVIPESEQKVKLDFRDVLWEKKRKMDLVCPLEPSSGQVVFRLGKALAQRAFVVWDYPQMVLDGGFYYTVDLSSFVD